LTETSRLAVFASGHGSNLQAILDACANERLSAKVVVVVSDHRDVYAATRAERAGIPFVYFPWKPYREAGKSRVDYDSDLAQTVLGYQPDLVILAGWMRILSEVFLRHFPIRVINLHPALPGMFPGTHAIERAFQAYQTGEISYTGVMVHYVPDEGVDNGPVIIQEEVPIYPEDDLEALKARIHQVEHRLLVEAIKQILPKPPS
jgi:formyltetrahydrofolate-dependent phosphoribosylglycinamide formyltransferase